MRAHLGGNKPFCAGGSTKKMGVFAELEDFYRSNKLKMTTQEMDILLVCKAKAVRDFTIGAFAATAAAWAATRKLSYGRRLTYSGGAGIVSGMVALNRSLNSSVEQVIALRGSRMQAIMASIILTLHHDDPKKIRLIGKHLYAEKVFNDSHPDELLTRWRFRNIFGEAATEIDPDDTLDTVQNDVDPRNSFPVQNSAKPYATVDPFECVFGVYTKLPDEMPHINNQNKLVNRQARTSRRARRRRHRSHNHELLT